MRATSWIVFHTNEHLWPELAHLLMSYTLFVAKLLQLDYGYEGFGLDDGVVTEVHSGRRWLASLASISLLRVYLFMKSNLANFFVLPPDPIKVTTDEEETEMN